MSHEPTDSGGGHAPLAAYELLSRTPAGTPPAMSRPGSPAEKPNKNRKSCSDSWAFIVATTWFWEVVAMFFSVACFFAIVGILIAFDQKSRPSFAYGVTLNAIVSILATASKSSLIYVISECMGQLKWNWFYKDAKRPLDGMQLFDSASRGPLGSLLMILEHKGQSLVSLGALLMILALVYDPFVQQIITYPTRETADISESSRALAKQAFYWDPELLSAERVETDVANIIATGVWTESSTYLQPNLTCSTGTCRWPTFRSVGICSKCENITSQTRLDCGPNGPIETTEPEITYSGCSNSTSHEDCSVISTSGTAPQSSTNCSIVTSRGDSQNITLGTAFYTLSVDDDMRTLIVPEHLVWSPYEYVLSPNNETYVGVKDPQFVAIHSEIGLASNETKGYSPLSNLQETFEVKQSTQCVLALCQQTYDISVVNGSASFDITSTDYGEFFLKPPKDIFSSEDWCWKPQRGLPSNLIEFPSDPGPNDMYHNETEFTFCFSKMWYLDDFLEGDSPKIFTIRNDSIWSASPRSRSESQNVERIVSSGLEPVMSNIAASFTKAALGSSNGTVMGTAYISEVYVAVDWVWIILPAALVTMGSMFLALTVFVNQRQRLPLWKSSLLAVLFHGLDGFGSEEGDFDKKVETADQMERAAQELRVRLRDVGDRRGLMLDRDRGMV